MRENEGRKKFKYLGECYINMEMEGKIININLNISFRDEHQSPNLVNLPPSLTSNA